MDRNAQKDSALLTALRVGIDTSQEAVIYMRADCHVCRSEGFDAQARVEVVANGRKILATLSSVKSDFLQEGQAGLSEVAWARLGLSNGEKLQVRHPPPITSLRHVRAKLYGNHLDAPAYRDIINDVVAGHYSDIHLSALISSLAGSGLNQHEMVALTNAMINVGEQLDWGESTVVDKHCVGGLPGNRTTPIIVAIVAAQGLTMPKTSSRAITSPAGTADTMETLAPVQLNTTEMRRVVEQEGGCIVWGGAVRLSPADDVLIRIERALDIDSEGQLVASVLSKKVAAGSTHVVLDLPTGPTAKVRSQEAAASLSGNLTAVADGLGLKTRCVISDGFQPVGRGIGPALEAHDVLAILQNDPSAPHDLRERALFLAGELFDMVGKTPKGQGYQLAEETLNTGQAWKKFEAICQAQGGLRAPPKAREKKDILAKGTGHIANIDNRRLAKIAKLAGAPSAAAAGLYLYKRLGNPVTKGEPLFTIHAESPGELAYATAYAAANPDIIALELS